MESISRLDPMTTPVVTFIGGSGSALLAWAASKKLTLATVVLPAWMEWSGAIFSWLGMVAGGITGCISLYLIIRGRLLAKSQKRRKEDRDAHTKQTSS